MTAIGIALFLVLGLLQYLVLMAGLATWLGLSGPGGAVAAGALVVLPLLGAVFGLGGLVNGRGWAAWQAALLFFVLIAVLLGIGSIGALGGWFGRLPGAA